MSKLKSLMDLSWQYYVANKRAVILRGAIATLAALAYVIRPLAIPFVVLASILFLVPQE